MTKKSWKKWLAASAALTLAAGLVAVSTTSPAYAASKTTLKLWVPTDSKDSYKDIVKNFEKETTLKLKKTLKKTQVKPQMSSHCHMTNLVNWLSLVSSKKYQANTLKKSRVTTQNNLFLVHSIKVKPTPFHLVSSHKFSSITRKNFQQMMSNLTKPSLQKQPLVLTSSK